MGLLILLVAFHLKEKPLPIWMMLAHGTVAVITFVILLTAIFGT